MNAELMGVWLMIYFYWAFWFIVGIFVLTIVVKDDGLLEWMSKCPIPGGYVILITAWPVFVIFWIKDKRARQHQHKNLEM